jgi:uncharacterized protein (DUF433 family)
VYARNTIGRVSTSRLGKHETKPERAQTFKYGGGVVFGMGQVKRGIVQELHDEPHLQGRRITVQFIKEQIEERGLAPRTVADRHDLDVADVYRALTYYHDHPEEMRQVERQRQSAIEEHAHLTTDPDEVRE